MSRKRKLKPKRYELEIETLSHEGRGITHLDKKVIFVSGALSGEKVVAERVFSRAKFEETLALLGQGLKKSPIGQKLDFANHPLVNLIGSIYLSGLLPT
jgi:predicted RNA-binding protein with TRAM domain